ncbi:LCP family protein [Streptomyces sp. S3(2020)]|uniref:LCP family protein n=1 Tax=Streptomyces sp. S3(2020) TaxID=2732044 RepID=UPI001489FF50|nr:LCP family protein [Streptomyces sp. S3(2020)]NNN35623.1 LCP family protein [Streptomyces sp. S3(2020)]
MTITSTRRPAPPRHRQSGRRRAGRRRGRRIRVALLVCLSVMVLATAGAGWLYLRLDGNISTFDSGGLSGHRPDAAASKGENVLLIGSDARTDGNDKLGGGDKDDIGRSDTTFLLHIYADHRHALAVSIPRDTLVTVPPCRLPDGSWTKTLTDTMFNAAYSVGDTAKGNPACTQNTVEHLTGLRVDHTVVVDFKGFARLTEVVGGVKVCLPQDVHQNDLDPHRTTPGRLLFAKGEQTVSGQKALDYVRIRHGIGDGSDIGRIKRQQAFVASLLKEVKSRGLTPTRLLPLADAATKSLTVDSGLGSADKLISFAMALKDIDLHNTKFVTLPWRYDGSRVAIVQPDASELFATLKADRTIDGKNATGRTGKPKATPTASATPASATPVSGAGIDVSVYNGTTVTGLAARAAATLTSDGFTVTGTSTAATQDHTGTSVEYGPGELSRARTVAAALPGAELESVTGPGISVVLGRSYAAGPAATPPAVPTEVADGARSADDDPCSNLTYG